MTNAAESAIRSLAELAQFESELPLQHRLPGCSVFDVFVRAAEWQPQRSALTMLTTGAVDEQPRRVSYAELAA
jgi:fatty-acyl-CoA synthase